MLIVDEDRTCSNSSPGLDEPAGRDAVGRSAFETERSGRVSPQTVVADWNIPGLSGRILSPG